ncbi:hypothetical protein L1987_44646 [Smallanthus sonchifolius]|uniref:Uncharacterized protein n=1 Tax=Smallanthus sonchifolius TaxID=185202 RepID=A0ACB9GQ10_9ASTR|nr:hypothetical protein L1987_44646 [Smallanthus sonchifolius]
MLIMNEALEGEQPHQIDNQPPITTLKPILVNPHTSVGGSSSYKDALLDSCPTPEHVFLHDTECNALKTWKHCSVIANAKDMDVMFSSSHCANKFLYDYKHIWKAWFSNLTIWEGQFLDFERIAWLHVLGLPLHLWERVLLKSGNRIREEIMVAHMNDSFLCWVIEEYGNLVLDFLYDGYSSPHVDGSPPTPKVATPSSPSHSSSAKYNNFIVVSHYQTEGDNHPMEDVK